MLDKAGQARKKSGQARPAGPPLDFQEHLRQLEARRALVTRIDRPINKDTELHPLVRWQFQGGLPEDERRAFLFTNVVDGDGRRYDMPVAVGALAASPRDLCASAWACRSTRSATPGPRRSRIRLPPVTVDRARRARRW